MAGLFILLFILVASVFGLISIYQYDVQAVTTQFRVFRICSARTRTRILTHYGRRTLYTLHCARLRDLLSHIGSLLGLIAAYYPKLTISSCAIDILWAFRPLCVQSLLR